MSDNDKIHYCNKCGPFVKVLKEFWTSESECPYKIELIQYIRHTPVVVEKIKLKAKPEGESLEYIHCGRCNAMISVDATLTWTNKE